MDEKSSKVPETKAKAKAKAPKPQKQADTTSGLLDWKVIGQTVEAELKEKGWTKEKQRRNPRYLDGVLRRLVMRPLVQAIQKKL